MSAGNIRIFDTTLRDGEQTPGVSLTSDEKVRIARQLDKLGVDAIEAGFPIASAGETESVAAVAHAGLSCEIVGLARKQKRHRRGTGHGGQLRTRIHSDLRPSPKTQTEIEQRGRAQTHCGLRILRKTARKGR